MTPEPISKPPAATRKPALRRSVAGVLAAGALLTGTASVIGAAIVLTAGPAYATPEEDCAAVRARDHQIYLNLIASLPPGSPIPPEYINPCLTAPPTTTTTPPTSTAGLPGAQAPGGGPNVGANAPTNFPTYNGTPIVPVPGVAQTATPGAPAAPGVESPAGVPAATATSGGAPTSSQPAGSTAPTAVPDRGPGPIPTNTAPAQPVSESGSSVAGEGADRDRYLELVLVGAAAFTAAGIGVRGRPGPFSPRTPESILSQAVGTVASPLIAYAPGGQSKITVPDPGGGRRTFFLIHDPSSSHESVIPVDVPPGGRMSVGPDGSVTVVDADGNPVSTVAAPWAYDADGTPIPTHYEIRDGHLVQVVDTVGIENILYPILADPLSGGENAATGRSITATPLYNGQDAISGQPGGIAVVGAPDPGYSPYQPTTDTVKDGTDLTVDQGGGTTNRYTGTGTGTGTDAGLPYTTEATTDTYQQMAEDQAAAEQAADDAAARAEVDRAEALRESAAERGRDDWFSEQGAALTSLFRFSQNVRGANGIDGFAEAGSDLLGLGKSVAQAAVEYNRDPTGTTGEVLGSALRLDALENEGPGYWAEQMRLDAGVAVLTGPFAEAGAASRAASVAGRLEPGIARTAADEVAEGLGRGGADSGATRATVTPETAAPASNPTPTPKPATGIGIGAYPDPAGIDPEAVRLFPPDATPYGPGGTPETWQAAGFGYPDHLGFVVDPVTSLPVYERLPQFPPGATFDRFGEPRGRFLGTDGDPFPARSLPPESAAEPYYRYIVDQPLPDNLAVLTGEIAKAFAADGGGTQFVVTRIDDVTGLPILRRGDDHTNIKDFSLLTIQEMINADIIKQIYPPSPP
ncbi:hypothetical protein RhoFasGS6_01422 [Rhodococcus fascians]|uniref:glycohydrolase toxin TNT-related protein n=1 Tax=Rhodococcoides fascians TaxID=1828 RepID=UPI001427CEE0|nr:hypothetical protein [Rhodococcus fascians]